MDAFYRLTAPLSVSLRPRTLRSPPPSPSPSTVTFVFFGSTPGGSIFVLEGGRLIGFLLLPATIRLPGTLTYNLTLEHEKAQIMYKYKLHCKNVVGKWSVGGR